ncbi:hypothetical protein PWT90_03515 [Aphanocladium album]|nr:hypothetical protein PWT90_03515 [Aphanocladium album]
MPGSSKLDMIYESSRNMGGTPSPPLTRIDGSVLENFLSFMDEVKKNPGEVAACVAAWPGAVQSLRSVLPTSPAPLAPAPALDTSDATDESGRGDAESGNKNAKEGTQQPRKT